MDRVKRRPNFIAIAQAIEKFDGESAEVSAVVQTLLALREFGHHHVAVSLQVFVARARVHQSNSGKIVTTGVVSSQLAIRRFPSAERLGGRWSTGVDSKRMQQTISRQRMQISLIGFHCLFAWTVAKPHLLHRKRAHPP